MEQTPTGRLAALAVETPAEAIPPDACDAACDLVLDAVGVAHAGWQAPGVGAALGLARQSGGRGEATVLAHGDCLPMPQAAFANGVLIHAQNAGNRQALYDKTLTKRLQPGFAARDALWAAGLARRGISGPPHAIQGDAGLMRVHARIEEIPDLRRLDAAPDRWAVQDVWIKRFPSCGACHQVTQVGLNLAGKRNWRLEDIQEAWIYLGEGGNRMVGAPFERGRNPQADAQFSAAYGASVALLRGRAGPREYAPERITEDVEVARLAAGMRVVEHLENPPAMRGSDDGMPAFADTPHLLHVRTRDGREHERTATLREVVLPVGTARREAISGKFHDCTACSGLYSRRQSAALADRIYTLPGANTIDPLFPCPE